MKTIKAALVVLSILASASVANAAERVAEPKLCLNYDVVELKPAGREVLVCWTGKDESKPVIHEHFQLINLENDGVKYVVAVWFKAPKASK